MIFSVFGTYIDSGRLSFNNWGLKENVLVNETKVLVEFSDRAGEDPLSWTTTSSSCTLFDKCKDWRTFGISELGHHPLASLESNNLFITEIDNTASQTNVESKVVKEKRFFQK